MAGCKFSIKLNRLCKSSSDSIDNINEFDSFKSYMHVVRTAEEDLKELLRKVNASGKKTLVLLCGSAGDGKSHLLSYLKNLDEEHLLDQYHVYNDATESSAPSKTAIETLNEFLEPYKDSNLEIPGRNVILAINLGVLSNFIESQYGDEYSVLRNYVANNNILTVQVGKNEYDVNSYFQHVSFSDYHMYSLTEKGVHAEYIENILDKVFCSKEENVFYWAYKEFCSICPLSQKCPVKKNYEYMMKSERQRFVAELLVKMTIQDKFILTTRELLNFIYNILVSQEFSYRKFQELLVDESAYIKEFLKQVTPTLLFDSADVTVLLTLLKKYDPLLNRSEEVDDNAISYYVSSDVSFEVRKAFVENTFGDVICENNIIAKINEDKYLKSSVYNSIVRVMAIDRGFIPGDIYGKYLKDLYWYNSGNDKKLRTLYGMVEKAVTQWCGSDEEGSICLENKHKGFCLYEKVKFDASPNLVSCSVETGELQRFVPTIVTAFELYGKVIKLEINYSLYETIYKLNQGYIQTADDRNNYTDFISFVNCILQTGTLAKSLSVISEDGRKAIISQDRFGYKFKVVK